MKSLTISKMMLKMWQQEMYKLFDTQTKRIIVVLFFLFAVTMGAIIGYSFTGVFMKAFLNGDERSLGLLVVSMAINASIFTSLLFVLIKVRTPEQDRFSMQLSWFPLSTFQKSFGYFIPMVTVVTGLVLFFIGILLLPNFIAQGIGNFFIFTFFLMVLLQSLFVLMLLQFIYNITYLLVLKLKLPLQKFAAIFVLLALVVAYGLTHFDISQIQQSYLQFDYHLMYFTAPFFLAAQGMSPEGVNYAILILFILLSAGGAFLSLAMMPIMAEKKALTFLHKLPFSSSKKWSLIVKEMKSQVRNEENILNFLILLIVILFVRYQFGFRFEEEAFFVLCALAGLTAFNSFGNDKRMLGMYKTFGLRSWEVALYKFIGLLLVGVLQIVLFMLTTLTLPDQIWHALIGAAVLCNATALFYIVGILLPLDRNNPYTGIFSFGALILLMIPIVFIGNYVIGASSQTLQWLLVAAFEGLLIFAIYKGFSWRYSHDSTS
ncbi:hypothetical protein [Bacillus sp. WP8]|uniref:hypothetical protein n=1 Tax=Bacillus sp. WP8 TaxID=756828 RepID=UPI0011A7999F|nr:hypothetical protein [Bacillus sp. WP8]